MGSLMEPAEGGAMDSVVPKTEPDREGSTSSIASTPEAEAEAFPQDVAQTQKRKGGRKPVSPYTILALDVRTDVVKDLCHLRGT
jgi:hypothetical protein